MHSIVRQKLLLGYWLKVSGHNDDWQLTTDVRPPQSEAVWMSDAAAEYAKYATNI